jgi:pimeloyl-ACP methyl ester carboxylesterase
MVSSPELELEHTTVKVNGINLHVVQAGPVDGPLVILLHGFPEFWYSWRKQIPALVEAGYRVLVPDQRGYNLSDKPHGVAAYRLDQLSADIIALLDSTGRKKCFLVGHDWGANVAWWTAIKYPQRLEKLVILNVPHLAVFQATIRKNFKQLRNSWYIFFFQLPWLPDKMLGRKAGASLIRQIQSSSQAGTFTKADLEQYRSAYSQPGEVTAMLNWYRAAIQKPPSMKGDLRVKVPVTLIWGVKDKFLVSEMAPASIALCDQGRLEYVQEAGHWVQHEAPAQVNKLLLEFFASK